MHARLSATFPQVSGLPGSEAAYYGHPGSSADGIPPYYNTGRRPSANGDAMYHPHAQQHYYAAGMQPRPSYPFHQTGYIPPPGYNNALKRKSTGDADESRQQVRRFIVSGPGQPFQYSDYPPPVISSEAIPPGMTDAQAAAYFAQQNKRRASLALSEGAAAAEAAAAASASARRGSGAGQRPKSTAARRRSLRTSSATVTAAASTTVTPSVDIDVASGDYAFPPAAGLVKGESPAIDDSYPHNAALATYTFGGPPRSTSTTTAENGTTTSSMPASSGFPPIPRVPTTLVGPAGDETADVTTAAASLTGLPMPDDSAAVARSIFGRRTASSEDLDGDANDHLKPPARDAPYSRSPELKVSHKMAERKRRSEMTSLFDDLRAAMPAERGTKSSKWETLSKAIDYIAKLTEEKDELARTVTQLREKVASLEQSLQEERTAREQSYFEAPGSGGLYGAGMMGAAQSAYMAQQPPLTGNLSHGSNRHASPGSMSVQSGIASSYQVSPYITSMGLPLASPYEAPDHDMGHTSGSAPPMLPPTRIYGHVRPSLPHSQSYTSVISAPVGSPGPFPTAASSLSMAPEVSNFRSHQSNPSIHSVHSVRSRAPSRHSHSLSLASDKGLAGSPDRPTQELEFTNPFTHVAPAQPVA